MWPLKERSFQQCKHNRHTIKQSLRQRKVHHCQKMLLLLLITTASNAFVPIRQQTKMVTMNKRRSLLPQKCQQYHCNNIRHAPSSSSSSVLYSDTTDGNGNSQTKTVEDNGTATTSSSTASKSNIPLSSQGDDDEEEELQNEIITSTATATATADEDDEETPSAAVLEAQALREKARQLLQEANEAEIELQKISSQKLESKNSELDDIISQLLGKKEEKEEEEEEKSYFTDDDDEYFLQNFILEKQNQRMKDVTDRLRSLSLSTEKLILLVERIHEREMKLSSNSTVMIGPSPLDGVDNNGGGSSFMIGDVTNAALTRLQTKQELSNLLDDIVNATSVLDEERLNASSGSDGTAATTVTKTTKVQMPTIRSRVKELRLAADAEFNRRLTYQISTATKQRQNIGDQTPLYRGEDETMDELIARTMNENGEYTSDSSNMTEFLRNVVDIPVWVPLQLLPFVVTAKPEEELSLQEWKVLKKEVFQGTRFFVTNWDSMRLAAVYRGNFMRVASSATTDIEREQQIISNKNNDKNNNNNNNNATEVPSNQIIFADLQARLEQSSMKDKVQLFLVEEYEEDVTINNNGMVESTRGANPVVVALPKSIEPLQAAERGKGVKILSAISVALTLFTTFAYSVSAYALNPTFFNSVMNENDILALTTCIPLALGVIALHAAHEIAHIIAAKIQKVKIGLPVPLPSLQIGTFGSITSLQSFPESRTALLDVALSGPAVTMVLSLALMLIGVLLTINAPAEALVTMPVVPVALMKSSFIVGSMISVMAPKIMMLPLSQPVPIHPAFMVGLTGLISSALNMLPIGRLDGGRACMASFGRRTAVFVSFIVLLVLLFTSLSGSSTISIFWGLLVVLFQRNGDIAVRDEVTEVDSFRMNTYLTVMTLTALILAPFPGGLGPL